MYQIPLSEATNPGTINMRLMNMKLHMWGQTVTQIEQQIIKVTKQSTNTVAELQETCWVGHAKGERGNFQNLYKTTSVGFSQYSAIFKLNHAS